MTEPDPPVALITGAGSGIGRAAALLLAREGYAVALIGRDHAKLESVAASIRPRPCLAYPADIGFAGACQQVIDVVVNVLGRLDVVVNNAGWSPLTPLMDMDHRTVNDIFNVNALGPIWLSQWACRHFARQGAAKPPPVGGRAPCIVNVSSLAATDPFPGLGVYGAAKAAVNALSRAIATECPGVRSFAVAPGAVETPLLRSLFTTEALPAERCLRPEDVARVIVDCVLGAYDARNGETIWLPSP